MTTDAGKPLPLSEPNVIPKLRVGRNVFLKTLVFFIILNITFAVFYPMDTLGGISLYNHVLPGRMRLPYGDHPERAYNLSLYNLPAMFASHEISASKGEGDEFRIILIGDSATWGYLLTANQTLSAALEKSLQGTLGSRPVRVYNLGYPVMSLSKDLFILDRAIRYNPDIIIWLVTLESFPRDKQFFPPLLKNNAAQVRRLFEGLRLESNLYNAELHFPGFWERTILGSRRALADLVRLQFYGVMWAATGIDQDIPDSYSKPQNDFDLDLSFHNLQPPTLRPSDLALEILEAGIHLSFPTRVLLVNEPMFQGSGENSDLRYNFYYPRWAYDDYRQILTEQARINRWDFLDLWNAIPSQEFTNSAVHLSAEGTRQLAEILAGALRPLIASEGN